MKDIAVVIGTYPFVIHFFKLTNETYDGRTIHNTRAIEIRDDLDYEATMLLIRHEIVHALLGTQGRCFQRKFDVEEMCEFIAYKLPEINKIMKQVETEYMEELEK